MPNKYVALSDQVLELVLVSLTERYEDLLMMDETSVDEAQALQAEILQIKLALKVS